MKKLIYIVCGLAIFFVCCLVGLLLYTVASFEFKKNYDKTAAARAARHNKPDANPFQQSEEEINKILDSINDKKNIDEQKI